MENIELTPAVFNRRIDKLRKDIKKARQGFEKDSGTYYRFIDGEAKKLFISFVQQDPFFNLMSKKSILIMLRLNIRHEFYPFNRFGNHINID